jgi:hypothetical protein
MTDALSTPDPLAPKGPLDRPPVSGPGSGEDAWRAYASQQLDRTDLDNKSRAELIALVDQQPEAPEVRKAPEGVEVYDEPRIDGPGGPAWAVPVEGGYVSEDALRQHEIERAAEEKKRKHQLAVDMLRQRDEELR